MNIAYKSTEQISEMYEAKPHQYPKYGKSTTDPTYYEPSATRIANMKKASGAQLEGIYDFYSKDDVEKFNKDNFDLNIRTAQVDPMYQKGFTREEISQVTNQLADQAQKAYNDVTEEQKTTKKRIDESIAVSKAIEKSSTKIEE